MYTLHHVQESAQGEGLGVAVTAFQTMLQIRQRRPECFKGRHHGSDYCSHLCQTIQTEKVKTVVGPPLTLFQMVWSHLASSPEFSQ